MGRLVSNPLAHTHDTPPLYDLSTPAYNGQLLAVGAIWECDCGQRLELKASHRYGHIEGYYWTAI